MAKFEPRTFDDFFQRMLNRVVARTELTDLEVGGVLTTILGAVARELDGISYQIVALQDLWDLETATGEDLDRRAADANPAEIIRQGAMPAAGTVKFGRSDTSASVTIPAGTQVALVGGDPVYATNVAITISAGVATSASVATTAVVAGLAGNCTAGDSSIPTGIAEIVVNVAGVDTVINDTSFTGGLDGETDQQLRERVRAYLRSLPRGTPDALKFAVLGVSVTGFGRIVVAEVEELPTPNYGQVNVWVDDGNGTTEVIEAVGTETVISPAIGGETRLSLDFGAVYSPVAPVVVWKDHNNYNGSGVDALITLIRGEAGDAAGTYDYIINFATGELTVVADGPAQIPNATTSTANVAGLQPGDALTAAYSRYGGLIGEAQKIVDGDPLDRENYPGYRAAGVYVRVLPPTVYWQVIEATVVLLEGYDSATVTAACSAAIERYVNSLTINGDVIFSELVNACMAVPGVFDVTFTTPDQTAANPNVIIGSGELARTSTSYITVSGG